MSQSKQPAIVVNRGPVQIDVPRSAGYYGGIAVAVGLGMIEWPIAIFIGAIPIVKMLNRPQLPRGIQFVAHVFDGAAKPVGGDAEGTIRLTRTPRALSRATRGQAATTSPRRTTRRRASAGASGAAGGRRRAATTTRSTETAESTGT